MNLLKRSMMLGLLMCLSACSGEPSIKNGKLVTVESQPVNNTLFYTGNIQPLKTIVIPSPADGVVIDMPVQYGETAKAGQLLFTISSAKFLSDYKAALMQYIKSKNEFNTAESQLTEAKFLHKNQLISDDEFKTKTSSYYASQLTLLQAKDVLQNLIRQLDIKDINLYNLTIADIDKITQAMHLKMDAENLRILAPAEGVVLAANKNDEETKKIAKGDVIKQGDILAVLGDLSGLSLRIKVNELTINQLKTGQKVKVTGIAFPEYTLMGEIARVDRQAEIGSAGLPTFTAEIIVPTLSLAQQKMIHVGMSANIEIAIDEQAQIMIPIAAIKEKNGQSYIQIYDAMQKKLRDSAIVTGKTSLDSVAVLSGLKPGDRIVVPN